MKPEERFVAFFSAKGMRVSDDRRIVLRAALAKWGLLTGESLAEQLPKLPRSTIYRTLKMMVEVGLLKAAADLEAFEVANSGNRQPRF